MTKIVIKLVDGRQMIAELYEDKAPITCKNFLGLVDKGFYTGLIFHRVIPGFMIQGGGMYQNLEEKGGLKPIKGEFRQNGVKNDIKHTLGVLSMARTMDPNSATSQFFICVDDTPHLDGAYAAFGKLVDEESENVAIDISKTATTSFRWYQDVPLTPVVIDSIKRVKE